VGPVALRRAAARYLGISLSLIAFVSSAATPRIEARSASFLAVGVVREGVLNVHISQLADNSPVRNALVTINLRGNTTPTTAQVDGSYSLQTPDLRLPGPVAIEFNVTQGERRERLHGTLETPGDSDNGSNKNSARQLWWWVLNFAVCIGILVLFSRRKAAQKN